MNIAQGIVRDIIYILECVNQLNHDIALTNSSIAMLGLEVEILDYDTATIGKIVYDSGKEEFVFVPNK